MHNIATEWNIFNGAIDLKNTWEKIQTAETVSWHPKTDPKCSGSLDLLTKKNVFSFLNASSARRVYTHIHI